MTYSAPAGTRVGHIHLKVYDLDRSVDFYTEVLGFELQQRYGSQAAFLSAGGYHHHIGLNTWESRGGVPAPKRHPGLFHVAFVYPTPADLGRAVGSVLDAGVALTGAADHGVSQAVYLDDPDGNGIELYWDRPEADWPRDENGTLAMVNTRLDVDALVRPGAATQPA